MKKSNCRTCAILLVCFLVSAYKAHAQWDLRPRIYAALKAYTNNEYLKSAQLYSEELIARNYYVPDDKMLYDARMWALANVPDSAFSQLNRMAKGNYSGVLKDIFADDAFDKLKSDSRWMSITELLKSKGIKPEQAVKKNYMLIAQLLIIYYDDQHYRLQLDNISQKYGASSPEMKAQWQLINKLDSVNQQKVKKIIDKYHWPKSKEIDKEGNKTIFLVIQHAKLANDYTLNEELAVIKQDDQKYRVELDEIEKKYGTQSSQIKAQWQLINKLDSVNQQKVEKIIDKYHWPKSNEIDEEGSNTIFLVIQHANLAMKLKYLPLVKEAFKKNLVDAHDMALLDDRINTFQHKKQLYGTQLIGDGTGKLYVQPLEDPDNVDKRRVEMGLPPMNEYLKYWKMEWNVEQYKKDLPTIEEIVSHITFN
jgi:hypothetical protein